MKTKSIRIALLLPVSGCSKSEVVGLETGPTGNSRMCLLASRHLIPKPTASRFKWLVTLLQDACLHRCPIINMFSVLR